MYIIIVLIDSLATWNLRNKSPDIVFKFETVNLVEAFVNSCLWLYRHKGIQNRASIPLPPWLQQIPRKLSEGATAVQRTQHSLLLIENQNGS